MQYHCSWSSLDHRILELEVRVTNIHRVFSMDWCAHISHTLSPLNLYNNLVRHYYYLHFRDGEIEDQRSYKWQNTDLSEPRM